VCTLTWLAFEHGYELFFNRDEKRTRARALAPTLHAAGDARWIAPTDPDGGGTWLGVNTRGVTVALLNGYQPADQLAREFESRGKLVDALLGAASTAEVRARIERHELTRFRSFAIVAFQPEIEPIQAVWDGSRLDLSVLAPPDRPVCSSSLDPIGASASRRALFARMTARANSLDAQLLLRFHASHEPERGSLSPCMHRDDAQTVSLTRVRVSRARVELAYSPSAPCEGAPARPLFLDREPFARGASS
jgi:hypothetical protein